MTLKSISLVIFTSLIAVSFEVQAQLETLFNSIGHGHGLVLANPPMPSLVTQEGAYKMGFQAGYMRDVASSEDRLDSVESSGYDLSWIYHHHLNNSWGVYVLFSHSAHKNDLAARSASGGQILALDMNSKISLLGLGSTYSVWQSETLSVPLLFGPTLAAGGVDGEVRQLNGVSTLIDQFQLESSWQYLGWMLGIQAAYHVNPQFSMVPYFLIHAPFTDSGLCQDYRVTSESLSGSLFEQDTSKCSAGGGERAFQTDIFTHSMGLNLAFPGIGLTVGVWAQGEGHPLLDSSQPAHYRFAFSLGSL